MQRYFIELAYDGSAFNGWQIQPNAPSVQESLNKALSTLLRSEIEVVGAGRTDTGVHASFYIAHFDSPNTIDCEFIKYKLNRFLCKEIAIYNIYPVPNDLHARFSAISRTYRYHIAKYKNPFNANYSYYIYPLPNIARMNECAKILYEYTDFTSFSKLHTDVKTNNCKVMKAEWIETETEYIFEIKADRFLRNMVRAIVGTLLEVGQGKLDMTGFRSIIEQKNRCSAGTSVPGNALFLTNVEYPEF